MVWPTSPDAMACAGACRVPWTLRRAGSRTLDRVAVTTSFAHGSARLAGSPGVTVTSALAAWELQAGER
jgi:hypothetical protein